MPEGRLTIIPSVPVWMNEEQIIFDRKFYDGLLMYVGAWSGPVSCVAYRTLTDFPFFGAISKTRKELPFQLELLPENKRVQMTHLTGSAIVLASADDFRQLHVSALCRGIGAKCVYVVEYIPETRYQIVAIESPHLLTRFRRNVFIWKTERKRLGAFALAHGIQANGTAAYHEYKKYDNCMLYFDTRMGRDDLVSDEELSRRLARLSLNRPLRLAFSGRLIGMKGADHLIRVAIGLRDRGLAFHLTVYGTGELESAMRRDIQEHQLEGMVDMPGAVDFYGRLIPEIKSNIDLYVMLHRQSDPSCTYLETLSCGIPIVGYANKAFTGILEMADVGRGMPMDDVAGVVEAIQQLDSNRDRLAEQSRAAAEFSRRHAFEDTFQSRIDHLISLVHGS